MWSACALSRLTYSIFVMQIYREDPVIVAWNLINEPRCDALGCNKNIQAWVGEMAPYLKSLDPNHLITIGTSPCPSSPYILLSF